MKTRNLLQQKRHNVDGEKGRRNGITPKASQGHASAGAARSNAGATVAQNGSDSFFIHGKGGPAFETARHCDNRITRKWKLSLMDATLSVGRLIRRGFLHQL